MKLASPATDKTSSPPTCIVLPHPSSSFTPTSVEVPLEARFGSGVGATALFMCDPKAGNKQRPSSPDNANYIEYAHDHEDGLRAQTFVIDVVIPTKPRRNNEPASIIINSLNAHMGLNTLIVNLDAFEGKIHVTFFDLWEPSTFETDFVFEPGAHYTVTIARDVRDPSGNYVLVSKWIDGHADDDPIHSFRATFAEMGIHDADCNLDITYHAVASNDSKSRFGAASLVNVH